MGGRFISERSLVECYMIWLDNDTIKPIASTYATCYYVVRKGTRYVPTITTASTRADRARPSIPQIFLRLHQRDDRQETKKKKRRKNPAETKDTTTKTYTFQDMPCATRSAARSQHLQSPQEARRSRSSMTRRCSSILNMVDASGW